MSTTLTIRIGGEVKDRLDWLAETTYRGKSFLAGAAICQIVESNEWQVAEIRLAIADADAGDFATDEEVASLAKRWEVSAGSVAAHGPAQPRR